MKLGLTSASCGREFQFVLLVGAGQRAGREVQAVEVEAVDLVEAGAFEEAVGVASMDAETVEAAGFGVGVQRNFVDFAQAEFLDLHGDPSGVGLL